MKLRLISSCRRTVAGLTVTAVIASFTAVLAAFAPSAGAVSANQGTLVGTVPAAYTPNINDGIVYAIGQTGSTIVVGGSFTSVTPHGSTTALTRNRVLAFDQSTGAVSTAFAPSLDGTVNTVIPGPTANTVYVGGVFNNDGATKIGHLALYNTSTGARVTAFHAPALNGAVQDLRLTNGHLIVVGNFTTAGGAAHGGIVSLNANTGAVESYINVQLTGHHNYPNNGSADGPVGGRALDVSPDGSRAIVVGNFKMADGVVHDQIVMLDLGATAGVVDTNWNTSQYSAACASNAFDTYVEDVDFSPDGSYFAIAATGGGTTTRNIDGTRSLCDSGTRWSTSDTGTNVKPTWIDYTGNDTFWSVAVTGTAIYFGGHERWVNNSTGSDRAGEGATPRPGMAAFDPNNGLPFSWNPGRNPRGAGAYALLATDQGLYVGSDTDYFGNFNYKRMKIGFFPLSGGKAVPSSATATLPSNLYEAGQLPNTANSNVLYRVNAGGPLVGATDNGPDWVGDDSNGAAGAAYHNTGANASSWGCCASTSASVPATTPNAIFNSERWSPNDNPPMQWAFPVAAGTHVGVRLYFANRCTCTSGVGQRKFNVAIDGQPYLTNYDIVSDVGDQTGVMKEDDITSDGTVNIDFSHVVENPLIDGVELINLDAANGTGSSTDDLDYHSFDGSTAGAQNTVPNTGVAWGSTRGAFMAGDTIFYGSVDGNFYKASFDGTHVGTPVAIDPYDDPAWDNVQTGSGQTYQGAKPDFYGQMSSVTGAFFSNGRMYYSLLGQSALYYRYFTPESGVIGSDQFTVTGANFNNVAGMVLSGTTLYYASRSDGTLHSIPFVNGVPDGSQDQTINTPGVDWRSRGLFLYGKAAAANQPPTASATVSCNDLTCSFDGSNSSDSDGTVSSYSWNFGDGNTGAGKNVQHTYTAADTYNVSLTVTDNQGANSLPWTGTATTTTGGGGGGGTGSVDYVAAANFNGNTSNASVTAPAGISAGDTELLFVSTGTAGVAGTPTGLSGWTQLNKLTNSVAETTVYTRTAQAGDSGSTVRVPMSATAQVDLELADYSGVSSATPVFATNKDYGTTTHVAPAVNVANSGSWVLSYWSDRSTTTSAWTLPNSVTSRDVSYGKGGGAMSGVVADSDGSVPTGTYPARTATSNVKSGRGNMFSIVLSPGTGGGGGGNQAPTATATVSCTGLTCSFDGSNSSDSDGSISSYNWDFGDGHTGTGATSSHTYSQGGSFDVSLIVTDNQGAQSSPWTGTAAPTSGGGTTNVGFVADASFNGNTTMATVTAPAGISAGDTELLFVSSGLADVAGTPTGLSGWTQLTKISNSTLETTVYTRTAQTGDSGKTVSVSQSKIAKIDLEFADYSGVSAATAVFTSDKDYSTTTHVAPAVNVADSGSWVLTYWSDRGATTAWTLPPTVTNRQTSLGSGGGAVSGVVTDSNGAVPTGNYPSRTATTNVTSGRGNMLSIVLAPGT